MESIQNQKRKGVNMQILLDHNGNVVGVYSWTTGLRTLPRREETLEQRAAKSKRAAELVAEILMDQGQWERAEHIVDNFV